MKLSSPASGAVAVLSAIAACSSPSTTKHEDTTTASGAAAPTAAAAAAAPEKQAVVDLLKSLETADPGPVAVINSSRFIQHNLYAADGLMGLISLAQEAPPGTARANTVRVFKDGPYVFAHTDYNFLGPKIGFDIYRFDGDQIVEHWDNFQVKPAAANPSGHTMIDGPARVTDLDQTAANKKLVAAFVDDILVNGRLDKLAGAFDGDHYTQHNPRIADGVSGLSAALAAMAKAGVKLKYDRVHKVLGEGNFVLVVSEGSLAGQPTSFYDLFRVENGKIAEHWDTIETILPRAQWKNDNGKFGFPP